MAEECTGTLNLRLHDGYTMHVHLIMECYSCEHEFVDCSNEEYARCPQCGKQNWARVPV